MKNTGLADTVQLHLLRNFLEKVGDTNEDTRYSQEREPLVQLLIDLCIHLEKTSIVEDFEQPFIHPMITVQKWNEELKLIVDEQISKVTSPS